jgi:hypothetical protein
MAVPARLELTTSAFGGQRSIHLSYGTLMIAERTLSENLAKCKALFSPYGAISQAAKNFGVLDNVYMSRTQ